MESPNMRQLTVLIVDDSAEDRELFRYMLRGVTENPIDILEAETVDEARKVCSVVKPDCILLDNRMPGEAGIQLLKEFADEPHPPKFPIVMLTGTGDEALAADAMRSGAQDYLTKERVTGKALLRSIANAIEKVGLRRKIEEQRRELMRLACLDDLTGLTNRRFFLKRLDQETSRARRYELPMTLMLLDVSNFHIVNDQYGQPIGDYVLTRISGFLEQTIRASDVVGRYGGDEFSLILSNTALSGAETIARRLLEGIGEMEFTGPEGNSFNISCNAGLAELSADVSDWNKLLCLADDALCEAKTKEGCSLVCMKPAGSKA